MAEHDDNANRLEIVVHDGNINPQVETNPQVERRQVVLALDCPRMAEGTSRRQPQPRPRPRPRQAAPRNPGASFTSPFSVTIQAGQDIGETIRVSFEDNKHIVPSGSGDWSVEGRIYSAAGDISNPKLDVEGSPTLFEGLYSIMTLSGHYTIRSNGPVQLDNLMVSFQVRDRCVGGSVVGPLIAGCAFQVTVGFLVWPMETSTS